MINAKCKIQNCRIIPVYGNDLVKDSINVKEVLFNNDYFSPRRKISLILHFALAAKSRCILHFINGVLYGRKKRLL